MTTNYHELNKGLSHKNNLRKLMINLAPPYVLLFCVILLIALGTAALLMPFSTTEPITFLQSLFTATSAVTVTGLGVVDTGTQFTPLGQAIITLLIQFGGIGLMTFAVVTIIALGGKLSFLKQSIAKEALGQTNTKTLYTTAKAVILFSITAECIGIIILSSYWLPEYGISESLFKSFFYVVSAFNNAGFALEPDNLMKYVEDPVVNLVISLLIISGGLGFSVWIDIKNNRTWTKLSIYSKLMILSTLVINLSAFLAFFMLEKSNEGTLANLSNTGKLLASWFQAVSPRTAGFNTIDYSKVTDSTTLLTILLMFIGGGSLSTAGGIKVVTFVVIILASINYIRRNNRLTLYKREIAPTLIHKAFSMAVFTILLIWFSTFILTLSENAHILDLVFEVISALSTVGLSRGLTSNLSNLGLILIIILMIIGRIGPLTFVYLFATPKESKLKFAETKIPIG
ncbi:TrkH family potassium uptake protein [Thorsellia kenyensis]|uniref:TrkH family potassium uptake protein n=1 Tax=Thorsellia kenyensis TaxID=1549888 RepID=A0ABV6C9K9_9GAMM